jgi:YbbR domain-containing protein
MANRLTLLVTRNWPIKLAALFLSLMLYVAVALQQAITQSFAARLVLQLPPGRTLQAALPPIAVVVSGRGSELLKLRTLQHVITKAVPDTMTATQWTLQLATSDVPVPKGADVVVTDITPREITVRLDSVSKKTVRVVPVVSIQAESGYTLRGGLSVTPSEATVIGPGQSLAVVESLTTVPTEISNVDGPFTRTVAIDTAMLGIVRVRPKTVDIAGDLGAVAERSFAGIPVETGAGGIAGFVVIPPRVAVVVRGAQEIVQGLTRDSIKVIAHATGPVKDGVYMRLTVVAPRGVLAHAVPDSVVLRRKTGRD